MPAIRLTPEAKQRLSEGVIMDAKDPGRRAAPKRPPPAQAGFGWERPPPNALNSPPEVGGAVLGAGVGGLLPADSNEDRARNALFGAGVGFGGGNALRRMDRPRQPPKRVNDAVREVRKSLGQTPQQAAQMPSRETSAAIRSLIDASTNEKMIAAKIAPLEKAQKEAATISRRADKAVRDLRAQMAAAVPRKVRNTNSLASDFAARNAEDTLARSRRETLQIKLTQAEREAQDAKTALVKADQALAKAKLPPTASERLHERWDQIDETVGGAINRALGGPNQYGTKLALAGLLAGATWFGGPPLVAFFEGNVRNSERQQALANLGYGNDRFAIMQFQMEHGLDSTGEWSPEMDKAVAIALSQQVKPRGDASERIPKAPSLKPSRQPPTPQ